MLAWETPALPTTSYQLALRQVQLPMIQLVLQAGSQVVNVACRQITGNSLVHERALVAAHGVAPQLDKQALHGRGIELLRRKVHQFAQRFSQRQRLAVG